MENQSIPPELLKPYANHRKAVRSRLNAPRHSDDLDDIAEEVESKSGASMHSRRHTPRNDHPKGVGELTARGRRKVWKDRFWKRRRLDRSLRNRKWGS